MPPLKNLTGQIFGKLIVLEKAPSRNKHVYWKCKCECGNVLEVQADALNRGKLKVVVIVEVILQNC